MEGCVSSLIWIRRTVCQACVFSHHDHDKGMNEIGLLSYYIILSFVLIWSSFKTYFFGYLKMSFTLFLKRSSSAFFGGKYQWSPPVAATGLGYWLLVARTDDCHGWASTVAAIDCQKRSSLCQQNKNIHGFQTFSKGVFWEENRARRGERDEGQEIILE